MFKSNIIPFIFCFMCLFSSCSGESESDRGDHESFEARRRNMVETQIVRRGIRDEKVLGAMRSVPRHLFIPERYRGQAYIDGALPIEENQTISQPYIVAIMTELLEIDSTSKVLEIGTGSGYQAAVLGEISNSVYTIEIIPELAYRADTLLDSLGYKNVHVRAGDGYRGWPEEAPFDAIIVTAAAPDIPEPLVEQLKRGGRMVIPVGEFSQDLLLIRKNDTGMTQQSVIPVRFVPMTGEIRDH
jgi:protein-L-isoaspartate(D-aspartate) O-methyltransferase